MNRRGVGVLLTLFVVLAMIYIGSNIKLHKLHAKSSGMVVADLIIKDRKTVPSSIQDERKVVDIRISVKEIFNKLKVNGTISIGDETYQVISADQSSKGYIAAISSAHNYELAGHIKLSKNLQYYSISLPSEMIVGPSYSKEMAADVVHLLYGGE